MGARRGPTDAMRILRSAGPATALGAASLLASGAFACAGVGPRGSAQGRAAEGSEAEGVHVRARPDVAAARELDHEGVRSFREGRFADAVRYFRAAYKLGGPSSELWNIARSQEKADDPEGAVRAIEEYLTRKDLSAADRGDAEREMRALRVRPSILTVTTNPPGAVVSVDGKAIPGATPVSVEVPAGAHTLVVRREGFAPESESLDARFGRALIVALDLARAAK